MTGITSISVEGFKSFYKKQTIEVRPLTILAGVNSSGKSSIMQPLLLLKQTLEAPYDPGPLLLDGPNVSVTRVEQVLSRGAVTAEHAKEFITGFSVLEDGEREINLKFGRGSSGDLRLLEEVVDPGEPAELILAEGLPFPERWLEGVSGGERLNFRTVRRKWEFVIYASLRDGGADSSSVLSREIEFELAGFADAVGRIIHLPALRGNPRRTYRTTAVEEVYPGVFNDYTAGVIAAWQNRGQPDKLDGLRHDLELIGLTSYVEARQLDDASVELLVDRRPRARKGGLPDLVNIADVGFGVSQTLPVVAALHAAARDQLVYLEQPEIHLHPRAQAAFAELLRAAVERGVRVVVETHSALLIRAIQTMVAKGALDQDKVALHWFSRDLDTGMSTVTSATMDRFGAFGDWPEDFDEVSLQADHDYLTAVENAEAEASSS